MLVDDRYKETMLDICVEQSERNRLEAELNADLARDMARDPVGFNGKFMAATRRVQICPVCRGQAVSEDIDKPFVCECGWNSSKTNGNTQ